ARTAVDRPATFTDTAGLHTSPCRHQSITGVSLSAGAPTIENLHPAESDHTSCLGRPRSEVVRVLPPPGFLWGFWFVVLSLLVDQYGFTVCLACPWCECHEFPSLKVRLGRCNLGLTRAGNPEGSWPRSEAPRVTVHGDQVAGVPGEPVVRLGSPDTFLPELAKMLVRMVSCVVCRRPRAGQGVIEPSPLLVPSENPEGSSRCPVWDGYRSLRLGLCLNWGL